MVDRHGKVVTDFSSISITEILSSSQYDQIILVVVHLQFKKYSLTLLHHHHNKHFFIIIIHLNHHHHHYYHHRLPRFSVINFYYQLLLLLLVIPILPHRHSYHHLQHQIFFHQSMRTYIQSLPNNK